MNILIILSMTLAGALLGAITRLRHELLDVGRGWLGRQKPVRVRWPRYARFVRRLAIDRYNAPPLRNVEPLDPETERALLEAFDQMGGVRLVALSSKPERIH